MSEPIRDLTPAELERLDKILFGPSLAEQHEIDQFRAYLHNAIAAGVALGRQCVCGAPDCEFRES